jgi:hypothetical protein
MASRVIAGATFPIQPDARPGPVVDHLNNKALIPNARAIRDRVRASDKAALLSLNTVDDKTGGYHQNRDQNQSQGQGRQVTL